MDKTNLNLSSILLVVYIKILHKYDTKVLVFDKSIREHQFWRRNLRERSLNQDTYFLLMKYLHSVSFSHNYA